jgi:hypothetical protein
MSVVWQHKFGVLYALVLYVFKTCTQALVLEISMYTPSKLL